MRRPEPTQPAPASAAVVVVFDGVCALCSGWVGFLIRRDRAGIFRFAAMQSPAGRQRMQAHGLDPDQPASFLVTTPDGAFTDSQAVLAILRRLGGGWALAARLLAVVPRPVRDAGYRLVARHRYRWFGRRAQCLVPPPDARWRFL